MTILFIHEMGHFLAGRKYHLEVTLPYFIPAIPPLGTFGAFIKIRSAIPHRPALMRIGAFGPLFGAITAIPLLIFGIAHSQILPKMTEFQGLNFGSSILMESVSYAVLGHFTTDATIILHPTAMAAWFGLFVTSMNLLPMGQLDGGHIIYALFGPRIAKVVSAVTLAALVFMGFAFWNGWFVFGVLILFLGMNHPAPMNSQTRLDQVGIIIGIIAVLLFIVTFTPIPIAPTDGSN